MTRNEVLKEFGTAPCILGEECTHVGCRAEAALADRIVELLDLVWVERQAIEQLRSRLAAAEAARDAAMALVRALGSK